VRATGVLLIDRTWISRSAPPHSPHRLLYAGLAGSWAWMLYLLRFGRALVQGAGGGADRRDLPLTTVKAKAGDPPLPSLSFVPTPLCFDYHWPGDGYRAVVPRSSSPSWWWLDPCPVAIFRPLGFGMVFFFILAPTSASSHPDLASSTDVRPSRGDARTVLGAVASRRGPRRALVVSGRWGRGAPWEHDPTCATATMRARYRMYSTVIAIPPDQRGERISISQRVVTSGDCQGDRSLPTALELQRGS